jgi:hypothetical protein
MSAHLGIGIVKVNGVELPCKDFTIDLGTGTVKITRPLKTGDLIEATIDWNAAPTGVLSLLGREPHEINPTPRRKVAQWKSEQRGRGVGSR